MPSSTNTLRLFVLITSACVAVAAGYTTFARKSDRVEPPPSVDAPSALMTATPVPVPATVVSSPSKASEPSPVAAPVPPPIESPVYLIAVNVRDSPGLGTVEFARLDSIDERTATGLRCERYYFAADTGVCLTRVIKMFAARTVATFVDSALRPLFTATADGIPSRARISSDGHYAAFTVFVTGHSYADAQLSTATLLVDLATRTTVANLEEFEVLQSGSSIRGLDFNYWGVTFGHDSQTFYATLRTQGVNYLVRGDIKTRTVTIVYKGVECPSLSPDETRVGFKKAISRGEWRLAVLDLRSLEETELPETRSVDDQVEWLDNEHLLYALPDPAPWMSVMVLAADGSSPPKIFAKGAASPAVVRGFHQRSDSHD